MVAKPSFELIVSLNGLNLAKIHMVAKQLITSLNGMYSLNLAKIHMVAKQPTGYIMLV